MLDEPFSGLDPVGVDVLSGVLADYAASGVPVVFSSHQLELVERLCEAVAIIKDGRLVASGNVEELRDRGAGGRRVRVEVQGAGDDWVPPGAEVVDRGPRGLLVALDGPAADAVLDAARRAGTVTYFALERPTLSDLFREAVAAVSGRQAVALVVRREIRERLREKAFLVSTGVNIVIIVAVVIIGRGGGRRRGELRRRLHRRDRAGRRGGGRGGRAARSTSRSSRTRSPPGRGRAALEDGSLDAVVTGGRRSESNEEPADELVTLLQAANREVRAAEALEQAGVSGEEAQRALVTAAARGRDHRAGRRGATARPASRSSRSSSSTASC